MADSDILVTGIPAYGTLIQVLADEGPPQVFVNVEGAGDISGPANSMGEIETTSHSTGAPVRSFIPGLIDSGALTFPCFWNPTDPTMSQTSPFGMERLFFSRKVTLFQLVLPDPTHRTRQFPGFVNSLGETAPVAGVLTRAVSIRLTGPYVDVPAAITMDPVSGTALQAGGAGTFDVISGGSHAPWQALATASWITVSDPIGFQEGDNTVNYTTEANATGTPRTGHIDISGLNMSYAIEQA